MDINHNILVDAPSSCTDTDVAMTNLVSRAVMEENGWEFHISHWDQSQFLDACGNDNWYGYYAGYHIGSVSINFNETGIGTLAFGNCWSNNEVGVYLNDVKISYALGNVKRKEIQFHFMAGDKLQITEDAAIIKLHSLSITCFCKCNLLKLLCTCHIH